MDNYYLRFPSVLRKALTERLVSLPSNLEKEYDTFTAFRAIRFRKNEKEKPFRDDFMSQIELKHAGNLTYSQYSDDEIGNYGVSVFSNKDELCVGFKLPRKNKAIAQGIVIPDLGPVSRNTEDAHVLWFLFDNANPEEYFGVVEYYEKMDGVQEYRPIELRKDISQI